MALLPLSYSQRSLWLLHQFAPEGGAYNVNIPLRIRSGYDEGRLRRCLERLLERHEMLRARYLFDGRQLGYEILPQVDWRIDHIEVPPGTSDNELLERVSRLSHRVFALDQAPVFRVTVLTRAPDDHVFLFSTHHINGDLFSIAQLMEELFLLYAADDPAAVALAPVEATFAAHVQEQQTFLDGPEGERQWAHWSTRLAQPLPKLALPLDRPRPPVLRHHGAMVISRLPPELGRGLKGLAKAAGTTFFMALLTAFYALLFDLTRQTDLFVGTPVPGRRGESRFERTMGTFVNVLALRVGLDGDVPLRELIARVSTAVREGRENQDFPFPRLVEKLKLPRDSSRTPVFQTYFTLQRLGGPHADWLAFFLPTSTPLEVDVGDMKVATLPLPQQEGQMELAVHVYDVGGELYSEFKYNTDVLTAPTVKAWMGRYERLLGLLIEHPDDTLAALLAR